MAKPKSAQVDIEEAIASSPEKKSLPYLNEKGQEILDPTPMAPPVGFIKQPSMIENIRNMVRSEYLRQATEKAGAESFEEADDFEVDEFDPSSPYEEIFDPPIPAAPLSSSAAEPSQEASETNPPAEGPKAAKPSAKRPEVSPKPAKPNPATAGED